MKHVFSTENLERVFSKPENDYEGFRKFLYDYTHLLLPANFSPRGLIIFFHFFK